MESTSHHLFIIVFILCSLFIGILLLFLLVISIFFAYRTKQKDNLLLQLQKEEIVSQVQGQLGIVKVNTFGVLAVEHPAGVPAVTEPVIQGCNMQK